jgi:hypothetical protein
MRSTELKLKYPNAQKHAVFSKFLVLPGEDRRQFQQLLDEVIEEWHPDGATEDDAVLCIAKGIWLKLRFQSFLEVKLTEKIIDPGHPAHDQAVGFGLLCVLMRFKPETAFEHYGERCLRHDKLLHLQQKYPASDFKSALERAQAIINEIETVLLPATDKANAAGILSMIESAMTFSGDLFDRELARRSQRHRRRQTGEFFAPDYDISARSARLGI